MTKEFELKIPDGYYEKMSEIQDLLKQADEINKKLNKFGLNLTVDTICDKTFGDNFNFIV